MNNLLNIYLRSKRFLATPSLARIYQNEMTLDKWATDAVIWQFWNKRQRVKICGMGFEVTGFHNVLFPSL